MCTCKPTHYYIYSHSERPILGHQCQHYCTTKYLLLRITDVAKIASCNVCDIVDSSYREGDLRLVGGPYNWEGRVEVFLSGTWSTIRDTSWTNADATVVCNQLGFIPDGIYSYYTAYILEMQESL